jgi:hypothetical protein
MGDGLRRGQNGKSGRPLSYCPGTCVLGTWSGVETKVYGEGGAMRML